MSPKSIITLLTLALLLGSPAAVAQDETAAPELAAERALLEGILADRDARAELARERDAASGERRAVIEEQIWQSRLESQERMRELAESLATLQDEGTDVEPVRSLDVSELSVVAVGVADVDDEHEVLPVGQRP